MILPKFLTLSLTLRRLHIRGAPHWVNICIHCLKQTPIHQELGCQKICASPSCRYKSGKYHISTANCVDQRNPKVTIIKYGLVKLECEAIELSKRCKCSNITVCVKIY
jgi:hypothetical protein